MSKTIVDNERHTEPKAAPTCGAGGVPESTKRPRTGGLVHGPPKS